MTRFLKYLSLGVCTVLLTILLNISPWSVATLALSVKQQAHLSNTLSSNTSIAQTSPNSLVEQGRQHYREGRYADAIATWQQTLSTADGGDDFNRAMVLSNLALAYRQLGRWDEANQAIRDSRAILEQFETLTADGLRVLAQALNTQGGLQLAQGQSEAALASWERATEVYQQADEPEGAARSLINQAIALRVLGFHRQALRQLEQVTVLLDEQTDPLIRVNLLRSLGETQRLIGNLGESEQRLSESLQLAETSNLPDESAVTLISLGNTLQAQAQQRKIFAERTSNSIIQTEADGLFVAALEQYDEASAKASAQLVRVQAQLNQLDILIRIERWAEAQVLWTALQDQLTNLPLSRSSIYAEIKLAENLTDYRQQADCRAIQCPSEQQIQQILSTAIEQAQELNDSQTESYAVGMLGYLYEQTDQISQAKGLTEQALDLAQTTYSGSAYRWQWQLGRLYKAEGETGRALAAYDAAFRMVQKIRDDLLFLDSDVQFTFRDSIEPLYREYVGLLLPLSGATLENSPTQVAQAKIAREVIADLRQAELENFLACSLINLGNSAELAGIDQVADTSSQTAILYPIILDDRLEVLLKLPNQAILRYPSLQVPKQTIESTLDQLRKSLERPYFSSIQGKPAATQIYEWLIQPARVQSWLDPNRIDTLVFVLDGKLRNIPMAALYDQHNDQYLVEEYAIAVTFGDLQLPQEMPSKQLRALVAGLSEVPDEPGFGPLTYVPTEITNIKQTLGRVETLENKSFTKEAIQSEINQSPYTVVHLATHGEFGFSREETFLLAANSLNTSSTEGGENALNVEQVDLNEFDTLLRSRNQALIELLVLSACETATGDDREVLGIAGLSIQAGARSTLATLWSISDSSTAVLMKAFYESLINEEVTTAQALRQAQRQLIQNPAYKPSDWAPYLLVGDWR
jgi:CHAT domain-containing protein